MSIEQLKPERLWFYFNEILKIPRPSKKEEKIIKYLLKFGNSHNLETLQDTIGNVIIRKPASPGNENKRSVILQSHIDMVCEKNADKNFDFDNDAIEAYIEDGWVKAKGTTLGADDGIGIAAQLAILEANDIEHGPIECLFTIDEETGLTGAIELDPDVLQSNILLNLDSEDEGQLFFGCAGGKDTIIELPYKKESIPEGYSSFKILISGLKGGHSGDEINKGLGNAIKILNRLLFNTTKDFKIRLAKFDGGNLRNAIAREAWANVLVPKNNTEKFINYTNDFEKIISQELKVTDNNFKLNVAEIDNPVFVFDIKTQESLISSLYACPHGVIAMSAEIENFVETSTNLAAVKTKKNHILITTNQRSSVESAKQDVADMITNTFKHTGAKITQGNGYPGWKPNPDSEIVDLTVNSYENLFNVKPEVLAVHAGLECGLIGFKYPKMDMISFGPTIKGAHSPDERLHIESTVKFWKLLLEVLKSIN